MKSTLVDESLSYYKTNVLLQRILQDFKISTEDIMWGYIQQREEEVRKWRESEIQSQQTGSIDVIVGGKQQKIKVEVSDMYTETDMSHTSESATGTQEHIKKWS